MAITPLVTDRLTKASFENIQKQIQASIERAQSSILVSVAWFTNKNLLGQLTDKLSEGCKVEIIISDHCENQRLSFAKFIEKGGKVYILSRIGDRFLHDKFALFDNAMLIAGSYNWTISAERYNYEFIIDSIDERLIKQFNVRFEKLKQIVTSYDKQKLLRNDILTAETNEDEFIKTEQELYNELVTSLEVALKKGASINKRTILEIINNYGAIGAANRLIGKGAEILQSGLVKLVEIGRLDLSFEHIILKEKYRMLFDADILEKAKQKLATLQRQEPVK